MSIDQIPVNNMPSWLADLTDDRIRQAVFPLNDILRDSLFYPACDVDAHPIKYLSGNFYSFIYVDYDVRRYNRQKDFGNEAFLGYHLLGQKEIDVHQIWPADYNLPNPPTPNDGHKIYPTRIAELEFCTWLVYERDLMHGPEQGALRFSLLYIGGEATAYYQSLYIRNHYAPKCLAIIKPGWSWTCLEDSNGYFHRIAMDPQNDSPRYLLSGSWWNFNRNDWRLSPKAIRRENEKIYWESDYPSVRWRKTMMLDKNNSLMKTLLLAELSPKREH